MKAIDTTTRSLEYEAQLNAMTWELGTTKKTFVQLSTTYLKLVNCVTCMKCEQNIWSAYFRSMMSNEMNICERPDIKCENFAN